MVKFRNRVHFLLYFLLFEVLTHQAPRVETIRSKASGSSSLNKREKRKAQDSVQVRGYRLNVSTKTSAQINNLIQLFYLFVAPNTNLAQTPPSRLIKIDLEPSLSVISFSLRSLNVSSLGFIADELSAVRFSLNFKLYPLLDKGSNKNLMAQKLAYFVTAFGAETCTDLERVDQPVLSAPINLRLKGLESF